MSHQPSSGMPYCDPGNPKDLYFSVEGDSPEQVQKQRGGASTDGAEPDEGDAALGELGAGIKKRSKSASNSPGAKSPFTFGPDELMDLNITNRPGGKGGPA